MFSNSLIGVPGTLIGLMSEPVTIVESSAEQRSSQSLKTWDSRVKK